MLRQDEMPRSHASAARSRSALPDSVNGFRTMSGGALANAARSQAPSTVDAHSRKIIGPDTRSRRRASRRRLHGLLRPPPGGPLRPAALPVRSERSAVGQVAGVERPDKLQAPNCATDNSEGTIFQPLSGAPGNPAHRKNSAAPVSLIRLFDSAINGDSLTKTAGYRGPLRRGARLPGGAAAVRPPTALAGMRHACAFGRRPGRPRGSAGRRRLMPRAARPDGPARRRHVVSGARSACARWRVPV
jgi:hypothetical protein